VNILNIQIKKDMVFILSIGASVATIIFTYIVLCNDWLFFKRRN